MRPLNPDFSPVTRKPLKALVVAFAAIFVFLPAEALAVEPSSPYARCIPYAPKPPSGRKPFKPLVVKPFKHSHTLRRANEPLVVLSTWNAWELHGFWEHSRKDGCLRGNLELRDSRRYRGKPDANGWYHVVITGHNLPAGRSSLFIGVQLPDTWEGPDSPYYVDFDVGSVRSRSTPPSPSWDNWLNVNQSGINVDGSRTGRIQAQANMNFLVPSGVRVRFDIGFVACEATKCRQLIAARTEQVSPTFNWFNVDDQASGAKYRLAWPWNLRGLDSEPLATSDALAAQMRDMIAAGQRVKARSRTTVSRLSDGKILARITRERVVSSKTF